MGTAARTRYLTGKIHLPVYMHVVMVVPGINVKILQRVLLYLVCAFLVNIVVSVVTSVVMSPLSPVQAAYNLSILSSIAMACAGIPAAILFGAMQMTRVRHCPYLPYVTTLAALVIFNGVYAYWAGENHAILTNLVMPDEWIIAIPIMTTVSLLLTAYLIRLWQQSGAGA
ncbi:MAG: hypothetical protein AAFR56_18855, partial [Chloroflexota bacterium]